MLGRVSPYQDEELSYICEKSQQRAPQDYLSTTQFGRMTDLDRTQAVSWMFQASNGIQACSKTVQLAVNYLDSFLSATPIKHFQVLEVLSLTALGFALRYEKGRSFSLTEAHAFSGGRYGLQDLVVTEQYFLKQLNWDLDLPTASEFVAQLLSVTCEQFDHSHLFELANSYLEVCYIDYALSRRGPLVLAVSATLCVFEKLNCVQFRNEWLALVCEKCSVSSSECETVVRVLRERLDLQPSSTEDSSTQAS